MSRTATTLLRTVAVAALGATVVVANPTEASPSGSLLTLRAAHTASARLDVTATATLPEYEPSPDPNPMPTGVVHGDVRSVAIAIFRGKSLIYGLMLDQNVAQPLTWGQWPLQLTRGAYTVILVTPKPVTITLPIGGGRGYSLHLTKHANASVYAPNANNGPTSGSGSNSIPAHVTADTAIATVNEVFTTLTATSESDLCVSRVAGWCQPGANQYGFYDGIGGPNTNYAGEALFAYPGDGLSGSLYVVGDHANVGIDVRAVFVTYIFNAGQSG